MKRGAARVTIVVVVAAAFLLLLTLPPPRVALTPSPDGTISGNLHVHTIRSDGRGTPDEVAAAAARAGLKFIVFADHGDATRVPDPPVYRAGVLCLDGVEISTGGGHYVALDMPAAPYPLAGEPRDVVEDVRRLGGFGIVAHPDSPKPELRWRDWAAPFDGVEWINQDTSWRVHAAGGWRSRVQLVASLFHYPVRPDETLASMLTRTDETMRRWTALAGTRRVVILSGTDAHAKLALRNVEPGDNRFSLPLPSYRASFSTFSVHIRTDRPMSGEVVNDAALVTRALRAGHLYTAVDSIATPPSFDFTATNEHGVVHEGDEIRAGGPTSLHVRSNAPQGFTTSIWQGTTMLDATRRNDWTVKVGAEPAVYRVEIRRGDPARPETWLLSNPIYVRATSSPVTPGPPSHAPATTSVPAVNDGGPDGGWHIETVPASIASMETAGKGTGFAVGLRYALPSGSPESISAALVWSPPAGMLAAYDRLTFTAHAERPMRVSIQLRAPAPVGQPDRRWQRSVYLDTSDEEHTVYFDDLVASPDTDLQRPPLEQVTALMLVVDTTHTKPGSTGRILVGGAILQR